jgi:hypothetical protein
MAYDNLKDNDRLYWAVASSRSYVAVVTSVRDDFNALSVHLLLFKDKNCKSSNCGIKSIDQVRNWL